MNHETNPFSFTQIVVRLHLSVLGMCRQRIRRRISDLEVYAA